MYKLLIINILHTSSFFSDIKIEVKVTSDRVTFSRKIKLIII